MNFHTVIFGAHATGLNTQSRINPATLRTDSLEDDLEYNRNILIVDEDPLRLKQAQDKGFQTLKIDYMEDDDLRSIGIGSHVEQAFCLLEDESSNVFLILSTRALAPKLHIVTISESHHSSTKLHAAGANKVINPHEITATSSSPSMCSAPTKQANKPLSRLATVLVCKVVTPWF